MVDATISRVRLRDLARRGRFRPGGAVERLAPGVRFATESDTGASSIAVAFPSRPEQPARPGKAISASTIEGRSIVGSAPRMRRLLPRIISTPTFVDGLASAISRDVGKPRRRSLHRGLPVHPTLDAQLGRARRRSEWHLYVWPGDDAFSGAPPELERRDGEHPVHEILRSAPCPDLARVREHGSSTKRVVREHGRTPTSSFRSGL
jgi:hypothetical protein